jgi:hypothetical protein
MSSTNTAEQQRRVISECRAESVLDRSIRLAFPTFGFPESGESVVAYYNWKHGPRGPGRGRFWPLHQVVSFQRR